MNNSHDPLVCTLTAKQAAARSLEWADLKHRARSATRVEGGIAMTFDPSLAIGIADLAERERACCGFLSITASVSHDEVRLEVTAANDDAVQMIESIAGLES